MPVGVTPKAGFQHEAVGDPVPVEVQANAGAADHGRLSADAAIA